MESHREPPSSLQYHQESKGDGKGDRQEFESLASREEAGKCLSRNIFQGVGRRGLEPRTYGLKVRSSTIELATRARAETPW